MTAALLHCTHCAQPLDRLAQRQRQRHCGAADCRQRAAAADLKARWQRVAAQARQQVAGLSDLPAQAPAVLWLVDVPRELEPVTDELRQGMAQAWQKGAAEGWRHAHPGVDSAQAVPAEAAALCVQCAGACCMHGAHHHAFIDADVLARWQADHPGRSTEDAIADYLARLPAQHVKGGCAFHGAAGCTLPRERRGDVCNRYACDALRELGAALQQAPGRAAVALTTEGRGLQRAAVLRHGHTTPLHGLPQPDDLPP